MLFKYPQLLWSLWLLLIPILIHLLQLRRFKTTPFTNVRLLKKVQAKSQKNQTLKRWLLLVTRMALLTALILAFAQPFTANKTAFREQDLVIYLDNSFSMQARKGQSSLLEEAVQELINSIPEGVPFSLFTNDGEFRDVTMEEIRNTLLQLDFTSVQLNLEQIRFKGNSFLGPETQTLKRLLVLSDFQGSLGGFGNTEVDGAQTYIIPIRADDLVNISVDSLFFGSSEGNNNNLTIQISGNADFGSTPVSLFNKGSLIAKSAVTYDPGGTAELVFSLPGGEYIEGRVSLTDAGLSYDNDLYFNLNTREKIRILGIGTADEFLPRLFGDETTQYQSVPSLEQALPILAEQDLVILRELNALPGGTLEPLREFVDQGGSLLLIPSMEMNAMDFNRLLSPYGLSFGKGSALPLEVTEINYAHPLFTGVFREEVRNFQYPQVRESFGLNGRFDKILGLSSEAPFLAGRGKIYVFTASLAADNTNFSASPLIVPTIYAIAVKSRSLPVPYYILGEDSSADVSVLLKEDRILSLRKGELEFIPRQQAIGRKTRLWFAGAPPEAGTYTLENAPVIASFSFNYSRKESDLTYLDPQNIEGGATVASSITELFSQFENDSRVTGLWKWFVILALVFILAEIFIQKVMK